MSRTPGYALWALLVLALAAVSSPALAQDEWCARVVITDQHSVPDSSGEGTICTVEFCLDPPEWYEYESTSFSLELAPPGSFGREIVGIAVPDGWNGTFVEFGAGWWGPHLFETVCGFAVSLRLAEDLGSWCVFLSFRTSYDTACGYTFCVDCGTIGVEPSTWGRLKTMFR